MAELPLSKFAPFTKDECRFQYEISNKLSEIGVKCSNCIYFGSPVFISHNYDPLINDNKQKYECNILSYKWEDNLVCEDSLCRFFTNKEEVKDVEDDRVEPEEELSSTIQKLDFTNSNIQNDIIDLRNNLLNESK